MMASAPTACNLVLDRAPERFRRPFRSGQPVGVVQMGHGRQVHARQQRHDLVHRVRGAFIFRATSLSARSAPCSRVFMFSILAASTVLQAFLVGDELGVGLQQLGNDAQTVGLDWWYRFR